MFEMRSEVLIGSYWLDLHLKEKNDDTSVGAYFNAGFVIVLPGEEVGAKHPRCIASLPLHYINLSLHCFEQCKHDITC